MTNKELLIEAKKEENDMQYTMTIEVGNLKATAVADLSKGGHNMKYTVSINNADQIAGTTGVNNLGDMLHILQDRIAGR